MRPGGDGDQLRFLKRQLVFPVSMMSQWWVSGELLPGKLVASVIQPLLSIPVDLDPSL